MPGVVCNAGCVGLLGWNTLLGGDFTGTRYLLVLALALALAGCIFVIAAFQEGDGALPRE